MLLANMRGAHHLSIYKMSLFVYRTKMILFAFNLVEYFS